jgi:soluble lytic murein transglycosylase
VKNIRFGRRAAVVAGACVVVLAGWSASPAASAGAAGQDDQAARPLLTSSAYPAVSADPSNLWLVPDRTAKARVSKVLTGFAEGVRLYGDAKYAPALALVTARGLADTPLADYATYFKGVILLRLGRTSEAQQALDELNARAPVGYLAEAASARAAETAEARGDYPAAVRIYEELATRKTVAPDIILMALAKAAVAAGDRERAARVYSRLYYDYPQSDLSTVAGVELEPLRDLVPMEPAARYKMDATRAQRLFDGRRYAAAEPAFQALAGQASGDDRERFALRVAECEFYQRRYREARDGVQPYIEHASRKAEAQFFYLGSIREMGQQDDYVRLARQLASEAGTSAWAEETLNNLASHFIVNNDDEQADQVFRDLYARLPKGKYAERAAWKIGWWAYKHSRYADTTKFFEEAAANFPHSDYRPSFLYWSARAHEALGERDLADARYRLVLTDYQNTYYGHLTVARFSQRHEVVPDIEPIAVMETGSNPPPASAGAPAATDAGSHLEPRMPPNAEQIRALLVLGLTDQAIDELQYAQRMWGESPVVSATMAWVRNQGGDLRAGITIMKRAYPQFMAAGGDKLPIEIRKVMYPVDYWPAIQKQATGKSVDPYLVASLILQESTFSPAARSSANAVGLMQLVASTGRQYARSLRIRRFSPAMLTRPDTNLRLGLAYFSDLIKRFGGEHFALAGYNAGEHRVAQWMAERPGLSREEFIDDIPFPETQNYVKRILAAAEEYRRLYGSGGTTSKAGATEKKAAVKRTAAKPSAKKKAPKKRS